MSKRDRQPPRKPVRMTDRWVQNYKKPGLSSSDTESGMHLYAGTTGRKSWVHFYRHPISKKLVKRTMPFMGLAQARKRVADDKFLLSQSIDPIEAERAKKQAALDAAEGTLQAVAARYLDLAASKLRSRDFYKSVLDRHILPKLGHRPVNDLRRAEIVAALDHVERTSGARSADMALAVARSMLHWHERRSDTFRSPIVRGMQRVRPAEHARTRTLDDDEIRKVWRAAGDPRIGVYGQMVRFMVLTGARRAEATGLRRSEIQTIRDNGDDIVVWRLSASRSKTKREVVRPLSRAALGIINAMPTIGHDDSGPVFTFSGHKPMAASRMDKKTLIDEISGVSDWRTHDLRRTFRTLLSRCRVPFEIAERCLGHAQALLVQTYDRHSHLPAMLESVEKVAAEIERIVSGERGGRVVRLRPLQMN